MDFTYKRDRVKGSGICRWRDDLRTCTLKWRDRVHALHGMAGLAWQAGADGVEGLQNVQLDALSGITANIRHAGAAGRAWLKAWAGVDTGRQRCTKIILSGKETVGGKAWLELEGCVGECNQSEGWRLDMAQLGGVEPECLEETGP
ncbi:unnamed protein product [Calicophoron daubneyi]|uniref:Uncharacterized protein n=1 Tax=Calicophoron daubneyi TaxID=300641 RepID=A0AAV2TJ14_CALDB